MKESLTIKVGSSRIIGECIMTGTLEEDLLDMLLDPFIFITYTSPSTSKNRNDVNIGTEVNRIN